MEQHKNFMQMEIPARSENEGFARVVIGAFASRLDPTMEELADIKTAVSEAVTNAIVHAYANPGGIIALEAWAEPHRLEVAVRDCGRGIDNVTQAMEPFYTTSPETERSGMGFTVMQSFMDEVEVHSQSGHGTTVRMVKRIGCEE
ncbi:MAG: anti-sigma F factor [Eubacteriales bacterium]|nr:anti-sigma F factor [Eubacteriales bacterium]